MKDLSTAFSDVAQVHEPLLRPDGMVSDQFGDFCLLGTWITLVQQ